MNHKTIWSNKIRYIVKMFFLLFNKNLLIIIDLKFYHALLIAEINSL